MSYQMDEQTQKIHDEYSRHLLECRRLSFEQFDKAILTLSGGGLGLSITFMGDIVPLHSALNKEFLIRSWACFTLSMSLTLLSFLTSQYAFDRQLKLAEKYYLENDEKALKERNAPASATKALNILSAIFFLLAVAFLLFFVSSNISNPNTGG